VPTLGHRASPDGTRLAFVALVKELGQVGVMDLASGEWRILTHSRTEGAVYNLCWSPDSSRIYYDRWIDSPRGVYSIPALGDEARSKLLLRDADQPEALADGSFLVRKLDDDRNEQWHRFRPDPPRLEPVGPAVYPLWVGGMPFRVFPDGKEAVFYGRPVGDPGPRLHLLDLGSGRTRVLAGDFESAPKYTMLAVDPRGRSVLAWVQDPEDGELFRLASLPRSGGPARTLMQSALTPGINGLDVGPDETLYLAWACAQRELLRFPTSGGAPERLAVVRAQSPPTPLQFPAPDGRILVPHSSLGRDRLLAFRPGEDPEPFVEAAESSLPAALLGDKQVAFLTGKSPHCSIVVASLDGRIERRLKASPGSPLGSLTAASDAKTLYYADSGSIWSIPVAEDGEPRLICSGDRVTADPAGRFLIVLRSTRAGVRLFRIALPAPQGRASELEITVKDPNLRLAPARLASNAIGKDGRLLVTAARRDSWYWRPALLDLKTGALEPIAVQYDGDMEDCGWGDDGRILSIGGPERSELWRFQPLKRPAPN
jgi:hypothetical protein